MAGTVRWNKAKTQAGADGWNLTSDIGTALDTANVIVPVATQAERDGLVPPGGKYAGMVVSRTDVAGAPLERWDGAKWAGGDTGWMSVPLLNGFTDFNASGWTGLKYRIRDGWVIVNGAVQSSTAWPANQVCGYMPVGARPVYRVQGANIQVDETQGYLIMSAAGPGGYSFSATYPAA